MHASLPFLRNFPNCKSPKFGGIKFTFFARRMNNIRVMKYLHTNKTISSIKKKKKKPP